MSQLINTFDSHISLPSFNSIILKMCDNNLSVLQDLESWQDEEPTVVPPFLCAEAVRLNRFSIVGLLVNPEKQSMSALINQMPSIWGVTDEVFGRVIDSRRFQFVFKTEDALNRVLEKSPWYFADRLIVLKRWAPTVTEESLKKVQFWVQIRGIPPHYLSRAIIDFIGDKLGQVDVVEFDDSTNVTDYVWVLVNWNIDNPLRFKRNYEFGVGEIYMLSFHYDRLMNFCSKCGMLTHDVKECPLHIDGDACKWRDDGESGDKACGLSVDEEGQVFTKALAETGMKVGSSGVSSVPISNIPPIDCDKLAETLRYVKAKLVKGKSLMGHKLGPTDAIPMPVCRGENDHYNPNTADENLGCPSYVETDAVYNPMETREPVNIYNDDYFYENVTVGGGAGSKRKREENVKDTSFAVLYPGSKKGSCDVGDLGKQRIQLCSDCKIGEVVAGRISVSDVAMIPKMKVEVSESVGSCEYSD